MTTEDNIYKITELMERMQKVQEWDALQRYVDRMGEEDTIPSEIADRLIFLEETLWTNRVQRAGFTT